MSARLSAIRTSPRILYSWLRIEGDNYKWLALIVGIALAVRVVCVLAIQTDPIRDAAEYDRLALSILSGNGYVDANGAPDAFWPVGYPIFLATVYLVFGHSYLVAGIANALLGAIATFLTYILARHALSSRASLAAASVVALLPAHIIAYTPNLLTETLHTVLVLTVLIATLRLARSPTWINAALLGFIIGISVYVRPIMLFFPCAVLILLLLKNRHGGARRAIGLAAIAMVATLATISPWTIRNFFAMDGFVLTASNGGYNFYKNHMPGAIAQDRMIPPLHELPEFEGLSKADADRKAYRLGLQWIVEHPDEWLILLPQRFFYIWANGAHSIEKVYFRRYQDAVPVIRIWAQIYWMAIVFAAAASMVTRPIAGYWLRLPMIVFLIAIVYWTAFHMMSHGGGRFHTQMTPVIVIIAAHILERDRDWRAWLPSNWLGSSR